MGAPAIDRGIGKGTNMVEGTGLLPQGHAQRAGQDHRDIKGRSQ